MPTLKLDLWPKPEFFHFTKTDWVPAAIRTPAPICKTWTPARGQKEKRSEHQLLPKYVMLIKQHETNMTSWHELKINKYVFFFKLYLLNLNSSTQLSSAVFSRLSNFLCSSVSLWCLLETQECLNGTGLNYLKSGLTSFTAGSYFSSSFFLF